MKSIAKYRQVPSILFCLITGNKFFHFNRSTCKQDAEQHVCDVTVGQKITFVVPKHLKSGRIVRAGVDLHFAIRVLYYS